MRGEQEIAFTEKPHCWGDQAVVEFSFSDPGQS